jgi:hypothetical protein
LFRQIIIDALIMYFSLQYGGKILPVCLAESNASRYENTPVTVAGWGTISSGGPQVTGATSGNSISSGELSVSRCSIISG